jgi:hypothetical protein
MWCYNKYNNTFYKVVNSIRIELPVLKDEYNEDSWTNVYAECISIDTLLKTWTLDKGGLSKLIKLGDMEKVITFEIENSFRETFTQCMFFDSMESEIINDIFHLDNIVELEYEAGFKVIT